MNKLLGLAILMLSCNQDKLRVQQKIVDSLKTELVKKDGEILTLQKQAFKKQEFYLRVNQELTKCRKDFRNVTLNENFPLRILPTFKMHNDEINESDKELEWVGLFENSGRYYTEKVNVNFINVNDPIVDSESEKTGWKAEILENKDSCLYLISNLKNNKRSFVNHFDIKSKMILPGDTIDIDFMSHNYTLFATGLSQTQTGDWFGVKDYKLYIKQKNSIPQLIISEKGFDDDMIDVLWMGDIDNDGLLDMIIDTSTHYNVMEISLFLSSYSTGQNIIKQVASHRMVGC
jgi:hypothetical protein